MDKKQRYFKITKDGCSLFATELTEVSEGINDDELGDIYTIEIVEMTAEDYEKLGEFQGW